MILRDYQANAVESVLRDFKTCNSTLVVCPTGCGKTVILAEVIRLLNTTDERAIILAHREELLNQAKRTIENHTGLNCEMELGEQKASEIFPAPVLLASVQTMCSGRNGARRMHKFSPHNYGLLVIDEFHHATADSYRAVLDYFKSNEDLKVLGVTATPERSDEEALGQICESVAFDYSIQQAVKDGWLVPVQQQLIDIQDLDFSHVRTTAGELNASDLAAVMESERNLYGVCDAAMRELGQRRAIMFTVSVKQAEMACDILNRYRQGVAQWASGKTPKEDRRRIMRDFHEGRFQVLVNCNLVSEGFDVPDAELLIQARPTKSKLLYTQQLGRIMRPLPGTVDDLESGNVATLPTEGGDASCSNQRTHYHGRDSSQSNAAPTFNPEARRRAIALSAKPVATVMDFVGNAGKHKLVHAIDVLGGKVSERVRELAEREARKTGRPTPIDEMLMDAERKESEERRKLEAARKARVTVKATYTVRYIDPFNAFDIVAPPDRAWNSDKTLSEKQRALLRRSQIDPDLLSYSQGKTILNEVFRRFRGNLCSLKQAACLRKFGYETYDVTRAQASQLIDGLARNGWRKP